MKHRHRWKDTLDSRSRVTSWWTVIGRPTMLGIRDARAVNQTTILGNARSWSCYSNGKLIPRVQKSKELHKNVLFFHVPREFIPDDFHPFVPDFSSGFVGFLLGVRFRAVYWE